MNDLTTGSVRVWPWLIATVLRMLPIMTLRRREWRRKPSVLVDGPPLTAGVAANAS